jgi:hypothetical protein
MVQAAASKDLAGLGIAADDLDQALAKLWELRSFRDLDWKTILNHVQGMMRRFFAQRRVETLDSFGRQHGRRHDHVWNSRVPGLNNQARSDRQKAFWTPVDGLTDSVLHCRTEVFSEISIDATVHAPVDVGGRDNRVILSAGQAGF